MRKTITIPAAGQTRAEDITGRSIIIESCDVYQKVEDVPTFNFVGGRNGNPIYPRSTYQSQEKGGFNQIEITGTAESAGDEVTLFSTNDCLGDHININFDQTKKYIAGQTFSKASTDAAQALSQLELTRGGKLPNSIYVSARGNQIVYGFIDGGAAPDQSGVWHTLNVDDQPLEIQGIDFILKFQFASAAAGTAGELVITPQY